ncbi:alpha/beta fold hydrolase [Brevibacterium casei]|uniref:Pimeloyl-ACP methyl ester carboxylesterase n=1 Tax=Brevibacterium casei CIP 102111 TaxID=1255625 RepID=A0A2H1HWR1_9MICO|nr:alpha/beta fold hydrolase [Brevibacterium casei]MCT1550805.1 alpha/beta hydrolase [Brevibacterium casei]MCT1559118.1 alpha/beta hydrolase [Brevibacterium casei]MCT2206975.1 alpha/beta hydrolase [Brevibacterium casei]QPR38215.1 alpha/beta hydrolase [Brevibacterium casei]QPR42380.1 alpha/beta hydrolase [Brevibacterium casei]
MLKTFVLVSGAWHGGWAWRPVAQHLRQAGHTVYAPTLPGLHDGDEPQRYGLDDVIDHIVTVIEENDLRDVTLIGHSWGGYVITGAAPRIAERLHRLVYWSAFVPAAGRSLMDEVPPHYRELFEGLAAQSGDNSVMLPLEVWKAAFMQDADESVQTMIHSLLVSQPMQYFTTPVDSVMPTKLGIDVSYLLGAEDIGLPEGEYGWPRFAERLGVEPVPVPGSHESLFTRPDELADAFARA